MVVGIGKIIPQNVTAQKWFYVASSIDPKPLGSLNTVCDCMGHPEAS